MARGPGLVTIAVDPHKLEELLTYCTRFAKQMLESHGEFHPFGARGQVVHEPIQIAYDSPSAISHPRTLIVVGPDAPPADRIAPLGRQHENQSDGDHRAAGPQR